MLKEKGMCDNIIQSNVPLKDKNWFKTGGNAAFYAAPKTETEFCQTLQYAQRNNLEIFVLGKGANVLISDDGFDGLVIHPHINDIWHEDADSNYALVHAGAGADMDHVIEYCLEHNLVGLEELSGIPGTVGGSVCMNTHYFQFSLSDFLVQATIVDKAGTTSQTVDKNWLQLGYDTSQLMSQTHYLTHATFKLKKVSPNEAAFAKGRKTEIIRHRVARYPSKNTCGSFFRNFFDHEVTLPIAGQPNKKMIYVAYYLDNIGVKGHLTVGDAAVSHQHANMIINKGNATSSDIANLAKEMQTLVKKNFNIVPQPECQLIGFKEYPFVR